MVPHHGTNAYSRPASIDKPFESDSRCCSGIHTPPEHDSDHLGGAQPMADDNDIVPESASDFDVDFSIFPWSTIDLYLDPLDPIRIRTGTGTSIRVVVCSRDLVVQMRPHKPLYCILRPKREIVKRLSTDEPIMLIMYRLVHLVLAMQ